MKKLIKMKAYHESINIQFKYEICYELFFRFIFWWIYHAFDSIIALAHFITLSFFL